MIHRAEIEPKSKIINSEKPETEDQTCCSKVTASLGCDNWIDRKSRIWFPITFALFNVAYWVTYYGKKKIKVNLFR